SSRLWKYESASRGPRLKAQNLHPTKQIFVKLMFRFTMYVTMLPTSSARRRLAATNRPRRSSPPEFARVYESCSERAPPSCVSRTFSRDERTGVVREGAISDQSSEGNVSSSEAASSRCILLSVDLACYVLRRFCSAAERHCKQRLYSVAEVSETGPLTPDAAVLRCGLGSIRTENLALYRPGRDSACRRLGRRRRPIRRQLLRHLLLAGSREDQFVRDHRAKVSFRRSRWQIRSGPRATGGRSYR